jgi:hypothetical protein
MSLVHSKGGEPPSQVSARRSPRRLALARLAYFDKTPRIMGVF